LPGVYKHDCGVITKIDVPHHVVQGLSGYVEP